MSFHTLVTCRIQGGHPFLLARTALCQALWAICNGMCWTRDRSAVALFPSRPWCCHIVWSPISVQSSSPSLTPESFQTPASACIQQMSVHSAVSILHTCPTQGYGLVTITALELQDGLPSGDKDNCHVWCFFSEAGRGAWWDQLSERSWNVCWKFLGVQKTRECEFSLPRLPPGLGSRGAEILSIGSDASVAPSWPWQQSYLQIQEMQLWNKKELSGTVQKQTQTEQGYHFSGNKTDCVSMSKSIQAIKGQWCRASGIMRFIRPLEQLLGPAMEASSVSLWASQVWVRKSLRTGKSRAVEWLQFQRSVPHSLHISDQVTVTALGGWGGPWNPMQKIREGGGERRRPSLGTLSRWIVPFTERWRKGMQGAAFSSVLVSSGETCSLFGDQLNF